MGIRPHTSYISRKNNVLYKANKKTQYLAARVKGREIKVVPPHYCNRDPFFKVFCCFVALSGV